MSVPKPGEAKRGAEGHIGYLLRQGQHAMRQAQEGALADLELTQPQFTIMTLIRAYPGIAAADIARLALLTPQTVAVIMRNLVRDGWVARHADPIHGRKLKLALTDGGKALLKKAQRRADRLEKKMVEGLNKKEERIIREWLVGLAR